MHTSQFSSPSPAAPRFLSTGNSGAISRHLIMDAAVSGGDEVWLFSFLDMMLLLLTLFVFLFAYAKFQSGRTPTGTSLPVTHSAPIIVQKGVSASQPVRPAVSPATSTAGAPGQSTAKTVSSPAVPAAPPSSSAPVGLVFVETAPSSWVLPEPWVVTVTPKTPAQLPAEPAPEPKITGRPDPLEAIFRRLVDSEPLRSLDIVRQGKGLRAELGSDVLFSPGKAELSPEGEVLLARIVDAIRDNPLALSVEGHTDSRPIASSRFPSNWELSGLRAAIVARYLIAQGLPSVHIQTVGYADTRPRAPNTTAEGRARNRRVTLVLGLPEESMPKPASQGATVSVHLPPSHQG